ncbi:hypothetical protein T484DRAFT_1567972, partial [Baffinella frigidus]
EKLELHALYQQATVGDCDSGSPSPFRIEARAKWGAWVKKRGTIRPLLSRLYI